MPKPHGDFPRPNGHCKEEPGVKGRRRRKKHCNHSKGFLTWPEHISHSGLEVFVKDYAADSANRCELSTATWRFYKQKHH